MATTPTYSSPGQPTKYKPEYCEQLLLHMAEGYSFETFGANIRVHRQTLYHWCHQHEEFLNAKNLGQQLRERKWQELLMKTVRGDIKGSPAALIFGLKNVCGWTDKSEVVNHNQPTSLVPAMTKEQAMRLVQAGVKKQDIIDVSPPPRPPSDKKTDEGY